MVLFFMVYTTKVIKMRNAMWVGGGISGMGEIPMLGTPDKSLSGLIKRVFKSGAQGFAYDPNDLSTMYQDAAGTVPVTAAGQPVGLVLDKSKGLRLEKNLVLGDGKHEGSLLHISRFDSNGAVSDLSLNTVNPLSGSKDVRYRLTSASTSGALRPIMTVLVSEKPVVGSFYEFSFKYRVISGEAKILVYHSGLSTHIMNHTLTGEGTFKIVMAYLGTGVEEPTLYFGESLFDMQMDDFEYRKIQGNHAYQTTSASRPILRKNAVTGANYLEFDGTDDFLQTSNIDFTGTDKMSLFAGVRKLSDAATGVVCELSNNSDASVGTFRLSAPAYSGASKYSIGSRGNVGVIAQAATTDVSFNAPNSSVLTTKAQISNDSVLLRLNGSQVELNTADQGTGNYGNYPLYIGRRGGTSLQFNGHLYSLIGIGKLTTDSETITLEKAIAKNTGVTLNV